MRLTFEQIREFTQGAIEIKKENGKIRFYRMTEHMVEEFRKIRPIYAERALSTTDCRVSFYTDAENIFCVVCTQNEAGDVSGKYELFVDNNPVAFYQQTGTQRLIAQLPKGEKLVTIYLPCHEIGMIESIELDEGSYVRKPVYDKKFLFLGDSITQGYNATHDALSYAQSITRFFRGGSVNWAVGGTCFDPACLEKTEYDPDVILVAYGTNDYNKYSSIEQLRDYCAAYLDKLQRLYGEKKIFCISPIWRADANFREPAGNLEECRKVIIEQIEKHGFIHIDGMQLCPHSPEYYQDGFLHPNDMGFAIYAQNLIRLMLPHM